MLLASLVACGDDAGRAEGHGSGHGGLPGAGPGASTRAERPKQPEPDERVPPPADDRARLFARIHAETQAGLAPFIGPLVVERWQERLQSLGADGDPGDVYTAHIGLADSLLNFGRIDEAIALLEGFLPRATVERFGPKRRAGVLHKLAVANLRRGERANCVGHHNNESCIFPLSERAVHMDPAGARAALGYLEAELAVDPYALSPVWLLNVAHMALGTWPDGVPEAYRIPPAALASEDDIGRFVDVAPELGIHRFSIAGGASMDDFDGDGLLDVLTGSSDSGKMVKLFRNRGDGSFEDVSVAVGLGGILGGLNLIHGDFDDDGQLDVLVLRGGWMREYGELPPSLLTRTADGRFVDTTVAAGLEVWAPVHTAAAADVDNDGDLDLFLGAESRRDRDGLHYPSHLYRNNGDGTFEDVTAQAGVANEAYCKGAAFGDMDGDGDPDLYVSNVDGANRLYRNDGDFRFTDVALAAGVRDPEFSFPCWFFDYDNDGDLDLYVAEYGSAAYNGSGRTDAVAAYYKHGAKGFATGALYENDSSGNFRDVTVARGMNRVIYAMGGNFGDFDNDGWPDIYLGTGDPDFGSLWPNIALRNDGGERFLDITVSGGFGHLQKGHGIAFGDLDNDGDQDVLTQLGGACLDDAYWDGLLLNPGHGHRWLTVRLQGADSNHFGVGARLAVTVVERAGAERTIYAHVGTNSSFGGNSLQSEIGLGAAERVVSLRCEWPSGKVQVFRDVPLDQIVAIHEADEELRVLESEPIRF